MVTVRASEPDIDPCSEMADAVNGGGERRTSVQDEIQQLHDDTTELGLTAEDIFKNAVSSLINHADQAGLSAVTTQRRCKPVYDSIHQRALGMMMQHEMAPSEIRLAVELQQMALEFTRIAQASRVVAEHALSLSGRAETALSSLNSGANELLWQLVRQAYIEVRGAVIVCTTRDTARARRLVSEDTTLDHLWRSLRSTLEVAIAAMPGSASDLHELLLIGMQLEEIGNRVVSICQAVLFRPPSVTGV